jgi:hypothetical protein
MWLSNYLIFGVVQDRKKIELYVWYELPKQAGQMELSPTFLRRGWNIIFIPKHLCTREL